MSNEKDYYAVLGVSPDADGETIAAAYDRLAQEVQPDVNSEPSDQERMRELDEAFDVLDDPERRAEYDQSRASGDDGSPAPAWAAGTAAGAATIAGTETEDGAPAETGETAATPTPAKKSTGTLVAGIALVVGGLAAAVAGIALLAVALTDDDEGEGTVTSSEVETSDTVVGTGASPQNGQIVTIDYTGKLADGQQFDTSSSRGPLSFTMGQGDVIPGLEEGMQGMQAGGSRTMTIPPELAYGEQGAGNGVIPPNATITFDIDLLAVSDPPAQTPPEVSGERQELESGLVAIDVVEGYGDVAETGDTVFVHYTGWLEADGTQFDSSFTTQQGPQAFDFAIGQQTVIRGWDAGVPGMKEGGKRRLIIPAALGYADQGSPPSIPANANLIFDIELVKVAEVATSP